MRTLGIIFSILILCGVGSYYAYEYVKQKPPTFLVNLVTKTAKPAPPLPQGDIAPFEAPEGFTTTIFSRETPGARVMTRDDRGTMLVSLTKDGKIVALPDTDASGVADRTVVVLEGLQQPHGILVQCEEGACLLYVAETGELKSYTYDPLAFTATYKETLTTFPTGSGHFTRTLLMHPDGKRLLISVGSSCNVCEEKDERRATVLALDLATKEVTTFAFGLRNTVFMATEPVTGEVWGTDHGRDLIGDDIPPDEVNILTEGKDYGWPLCYGKNIHDTDFDNKRYIRDPCADKTPSHIDLQAHSAVLGIAFIPEEGWGEDMRLDMLVAYHGSWNRKEPTGYKVVRFDLDESRNAVGGPIDFLTGFLAPGAPAKESLGRPVDILVEPGGVVYVSDDRAGAIYRISKNTVD